MDAEQDRDRSEIIEAHHWLYRGRRDIVRFWLNHCGPVKSEHLLVDCGAGSGLLAAEMSALCRVIAIENDGRMLQRCRDRLEETCIRVGSCTHLPLGSATVDYLTALDQLEHIENDRAAIGEFARVLKPGGLAILTVSTPVEPSVPERAGGHSVRCYTAKSLLSALEHPELEVRHWNYINLFGVALRWFHSRSEPSPGANGNSTPPQTLARKIPPPVFNEILRATFAGLAVQTLFRLPTGAGLLAILQRRNLAPERSTAEEEVASSYLPIPVQCGKAWL